MSTRATTLLRDGRTVCPLTNTPRYAKQEKKTTIDIDAIDGDTAIGANKCCVDVLQAQAVLLLISQRNYMKALELMHAAGYVERAALFARVLGEFNILPTGDNGEDTSRWR
jgi:hypothetical protein